MVCRWAGLGLCVLLCVGCGGRRCNEEQDLQFLEYVLRGYDKAKLPRTLGVTVEISSVSELKSSFELDVLFSSIWRDPGLSFEHFPTCQSNMTLDLAFQKRLWSPNTCIINSKSAEIHRSPSDNIMLILYQNGTVWQNYRMRVKGPCTIDLRKFPFDSQVCHLMIESYSFNSRKVHLRWYPAAPVTIMGGTNLPDFDLVGFETTHVSVDYPNGKWDELLVDFKFKRRYGFFILQAYIPTLLTIFVAWISFWMDPQQVSARSTVGVSSFLAMTLQFGNILKNQPRVSYIKALDVWMIAGILFMFAALAELAIISFLERGKPVIVNSYIQEVGPGSSPAAASRLAKINDHNDTANEEEEEDEDIILRIRKGKKKQVEKKNLLVCTLTAGTVDSISRKLFPFLFLVFNACYWTYYLELLSVSW